MPKTRTQYRKEWLMRRLSTDRQQQKLEKTFAVDKLLNNQEKIDALQSR